MLDDLLETEQLLDWHKKEGSREKPHLGHTNLNYHAKAFEQVDHYLRNVIAILSQPESYFKSKCALIDFTLLSIFNFLSYNFSFFRCL